MYLGTTDMGSWANLQIHRMLTHAHTYKQHCPGVLQQAAAFIQRQIEIAIRYSTSSSLSPAVPGVNGSVGCRHFHFSVLLQIQKCSCENIIMALLPHSRSQTASLSRPAANTEGLLYFKMRITTESFILMP